MKFGDIKTKALSQALFEMGFGFFVGSRERVWEAAARWGEAPATRGGATGKAFCPQRGQKPWLPPWERGVSAGVAPYGAVPQVPRAVLCRRQSRRTFLPLPLGEVAQRSCDGEGLVCGALAIAGSVELIGNGFMTCSTRLKFAPTENRPRKLPIRS